MRGFTFDILFGRRVILQVLQTVNLKRNAARRMHFIRSSFDLSGSEFISVILILLMLSIVQKHVEISYQLRAIKN